MSTLRSLHRHLAACAALAALAALPGHAAPACPAAADVEPLALAGLWRAEFDGLPQGATLLLERHPEYAGSLSGAVNRDGQRARIAADLEDGEFTLEESADGQRIAATWLGNVVEGSCGREIRGEWRPAQGASHAFVLRRLSAW